MQRFLFCWWTFLTISFYFKVQRNVMVTVLLGESTAGRRLSGRHGAPLPLHPAGQLLPDVRVRGGPGVPCAFLIETLSTYCKIHPFKVCSLADSSISTKTRGIATIEGQRVCHPQPPVSEQHCPPIPPARADRSPAFPVSMGLSVLDVSHT